MAEGLRDAFATGGWDRDFCERLYNTVKHSIDTHLQTLRDKLPERGIIADVIINDAYGLDVTVTFDTNHAVPDVDVIISVLAMLDRAHVYRSFQTLRFVKGD